MSDILCVTSRALCREDFLVRIERLAAAHPRGIILREKDMDAEDYTALAKKVLAICQKHSVLCILHSHADVAAALGCSALHLPLDILRTCPERTRAKFTVLGASCHSRSDALEAQSLGCTYITAGHVFDTDCKKGAPGRGLAFLREVCGSVSIPVYAIGGIDISNIASVRAAGAAGACVMSGAMTCADASLYLQAFEVKKDEI